MRTQLSIPALGFAAVWVVAAWLADGTTFHLAPGIVAAAPAVRLSDRRLSAAAVGTTIAVAVALLLSLAGMLTGPSLLPIGGALLESVLGAVAGGLLGLVVSTAGLFDTTSGELA